jgi:tRNA 2-thiouridine synthesizing protein B
MLHTINKSPFDRNSLESCLKNSKDGAAILLLEDGVIAAMDGTKFSDTVKAAMATKSVYALEPDVNARGIQDRVIDGIKLVDYNGFVDLVAENEVNQSWL